MIYSMTGYAKGQGMLLNRNFTFELKSVNGKYKDITLKIPNYLGEVEAFLKNYLREKIKRGSITFMLYSLESDSNSEISFNKELFESYYKTINQSLTEIGKSEVEESEYFLKLPNVITQKFTDIDVEQFKNDLIPHLDILINKYNESRAYEGEALMKDMTERLESVEKSVAIIKNEPFFDKEAFRTKIEKRLEEVNKDIKLDEARFIQELLYFSEKNDITEEVTRLEKHLVELKTLFSKGGEIGKKVTFILQEVHREINTTGSKTSNFEISKQVVEIKEEIERIREQIQNIE